MLFVKMKSPHCRHKPMSKYRLPIRAKGFRQRNPFQRLFRGPGINRVWTIRFQRCCGQTL